MPVCYWERTGATRPAAVSPARWVRQGWLVRGAQEACAARRAVPHTESAWPRWHRRCSHPCLLLRKADVEVAFMRCGRALAGIRRRPASARRRDFRDRLDIVTTRDTCLVSMLGCGGRHLPGGVSLVTTRCCARSRCSGGPACQRQGGRVFLSRLPPLPWRPSWHRGGARLRLPH